MTTERKLITVVGAASQQGASVVEALLEYPDQWLIRGIARDRSLPFSQEFIGRGVDMIQCDINNREECCRAFADSYGVLAITNKIDAGEKGEHEQAVNMTEAARTVRVQHLIFNLFPDTTVFKREQHDLSSQGINENSVENYIRQLTNGPSFPHVTFLRVGFFYQSILTFFVPNTATPEFRYPGFLSGRIPFYDVHDTGKVVRECFLHPERFGREQVIPIVVELLTVEEICAIVQAKTDKEVKFVPLTYNEALRRLHRYIVKIMRWHHDFGNLDERHVGKTKDICPDMNTFAVWFGEIARSMEW